MSKFFIFFINYPKSLERPDIACLQSSEPESIESIRLNFEKQNPGCEALLIHVSDTYDEKLFDAISDSYTHKSIQNFTKIFREGEVTLPNEKMNDPRSIYAMLTHCGGTHYVKCPLDIYKALIFAQKEVFGEVVFDHNKNSTHDIFNSSIGSTFIRICDDDEMINPTQITAIDILSSKNHGKSFMKNFLESFNKYMNEFSNKQIEIKFAPPNN